MRISDAAVEAAAIASYVRAGGGTSESWPREEDYYRREYLEDARVQLEAATPVLIESLATEAFEDKKVQGIQRVLIGNWLRARA